MGLAGKGFRNRYHTTNLGWDGKGAEVPPKTANV